MATKVKIAQQPLPSRTPRLERAGSLRVPKFPFGKSGGIRFDGGIDDIKQSIKSIPKETLDNIQKSMQFLGARMAQQAQRRAKWDDHPERHRGAGAQVRLTGAPGRRSSRDPETAHGRWPGNKTAREGLHYRVRRRKDFIELSLAHDEHTLYRKGDGSLYNYGFALELGFGGVYAIILPTIQDFHDDVIQSCRNQLAARTPRS